MYHIALTSYYHIIISILYSRLLYDNVMIMLDNIRQNITVSPYHIIINIALSFYYHAIMSIVCSRILSSRYHNFSVFSFHAGIISSYSYHFIINKNLIIVLSSHYHLVIIIFMYCFSYRYHIIILLS